MNVDVECSIWLASRTRWVHLTKVMALPAVPRVGEWLKFRNETMGDHFGWRVTEVTYRERGPVEVWTHLLDDADGRGYSFETEEEFDECYGSYLAEGWVSGRGPGPNRRVRGGDHPTTV